MDCLEVVLFGECFEVYQCDSGVNVLILLCSYFVQGRDVVLLCCEVEWVGGVVIYEFGVIDVVGVDLIDVQVFWLFEVEVVDWIFDNLSVLVDGVMCFVCSLLDVDFDKKKVRVWIVNDGEELFVFESLDFYFFEFNKKFKKVKFDG